MTDDKTAAPQGQSMEEMQGADEQREYFRRVREGRDPVTGAPKDHPYWCPKCQGPLSAFRWSILNILHYIGLCPRRR